LEERVSGGFLELSFGYKEPILSDKEKQKLEIIKKIS
jgi:hypothetical protein